MDRDPDSPWNPTLPVEASPEDYEREVVEWLRASGETIEEFSVRHLEHLEGTGGDYEFDAVARFSILGGASITVVVECKRYSRPVDREKELVLWAKLQDVRAHKATMFATCGFQTGALDYARYKGIATVVFTDGSFFYQTKALGPRPSPPPWLNLPRYTGAFVVKTGPKVSTSMVRVGHCEPISAWLRGVERDA